MDNKQTWRQMKTTTKVANLFNQNSAAEIKSIQKLMQKEDLDVMLIREQGHREVKQTLQ